MKLEAGARAPWLFLGACVAALALVVGAYSNSFGNSFHFDDSHVIERNLYLRNLDNVPLFFTDATTSSSHPPNQVYRPLTATTLALDYRLGGGLDVRQFHRSQVAMLVLLGVLLVAFYSRLLREVDRGPWTSHAALAAATLFCVHTANTETLNVICQRAEILSAIGLVGSFIVYLYVPSSRSAHLYLLPMIVGAFAKSPAVVFAPLFCVYLLMFEERVSIPDLLTREGLRSAGRVLWRALPSLVIGAVVFVFIESMNGAASTYGGGGRLAYLRTQAFAWLHYVRLFVWPAGLSADTDWSLIPAWYDTRVVAGIAFVASLGWGIWRASKTPESRPVAFGLAWFALTLAPASSIFPLAEVVNEHRIFLPFIGLALAGVAAVAVAARRSIATGPGGRRAVVTLSTAALLLAIAGNAFGTYRRNRDWLSGETLWRDVTEKSPDNGRAWMNYGLTQMQQGRFADAKRLFDRAATLTPNYSTLEINLGIVTDRLGDRVEAERHFNRALELEANSPSAMVFYGRWLIDQGRSQEAVPLLRRAIELSPADIDARRHLLDAYAATSRSPELKDLAIETLALAPDDAMVKRHLENPVSAAPAAGAPPPETAASLINESLQSYRAGDFEGSVAAARRAIELEPGYAAAHNNLAAGLTQLGRWDEAIVAANEALRLKPDFQLARNNLAWAEAEKKKATGGS